MATPCESKHGHDLKKRLDISGILRSATVSRAEPSRAEPSRAEPSRAEPSRAEPSRAEPSRAEPSRAEPSRAEPSRAEPSRAEPSRAEPSRAEPVGCGLWTPCRPDRRLRRARLCFLVPVVALLLGGLLAPAPAAAQSAAPTNLTVTPGDGSLTLSWTASVTTSVIGYEVHYTSASATVADDAAVSGTDPTTGWASGGTVNSPATTTFTLENLTNGTEYRVRVQAVSTTDGDSGFLNGTGTPGASNADLSGLTAPQRHERGGHVRAADARAGLLGVDDGLHSDGGERQDAREADADGGALGGVDHGGRHGSE